MAALKCRNATDKRIHQAKPSTQAVYTMHLSFSDPIPVTRIRNLLKNPDSQDYSLLISTASKLLLTPLGILMKLQYLRDIPVFIEND